MTGRLVDKRIIIGIGALALLIAASWWMIVARCAGGWEPAIGRPGFDEPVHALAFFDGAVIAGGMFLHVEGQPASRLAQWDGRRWSGIRAMIPIGLVRALQVFDDGRGQALFIAGQFMRVARWDGANWSYVGDRFDNWVLTLATFDDGEGKTLYAGGLFDFVARWNGRSWVQVGEPFDGPVHALGVFRGSLYAGGAFTGGIARWDGQEWTIVDRGVDGFINAMVVAHTPAGEVLCVGGRFTHAGGTVAGNFAFWDGSLWTSPDEGVDREVHSMAAAGSILFLGRGRYTGRR